MTRHLMRAAAALAAAALLLAAGAAAAATGETTAPDGTVIRFESAGAGTPALVFVHGWSCDRSFWRGELEAFAADHRVVALDLAGHGDSGAGRTSYTMEAFGADVVSVLEALGLRDVVLVGHSMGGPVAVEAALLAPDRVRGIVGVDNLQDVQQDVPQEMIDGFVAALRADFAGTVRPWVRSMFPAGAAPDLVARVADTMAGAPPEVGVDAMVHTLAWMGGGGVPRLRALAVPVVCVNDDAHPTAEASNREVVPGFRAWIVEGAGHFPMLTRPAEFDALLREAVAACTPAAPGAPSGLRVD